MKYFSLGGSTAYCPINSIQASYQPQAFKASYASLSAPLGPDFKVTRCQITDLWGTRLKARVQADVSKLLISRFPERGMRDRPFLYSVLKMVSGPEIFADRS